MLTVVAIVGLGAGALWGTDHIDAPAVTGKAADIADLYVFQGSNPSNMVPMGSSNPGLNSDRVSANDKAFSPTFPYIELLCIN